MDGQHTLHSFHRNVLNVVESIQILIPFIFENFIAEIDLGTEKPKGATPGT
jgi:hypothetical protein